MEKKSREVPTGKQCTSCHAKGGSDHKMSCDPPWKLKEMKGCYSASLPSYGDLLTVQDFLETCEGGGFIDYDGIGHPVKAMKMMESFDVKPSKRKEIPKDATHIMWFNR